MLHKLTAAATAGIEKTRVNSAALKIGMYVAELDRPWIDSPFLVHGFTIRDEQQLAQLRNSCKHVYIDIKRSRSQSGLLNTRKPDKLQQYSTTLSFDENLRKAIEVHAATRQRVEAMFLAFAQGDQFDVALAKQTISRCVENIIANPDSMLWLSMIKNKDEYTVEHSLNVALLSITLGRAEGLDEATLQHLGLCAMLHDVGKVKIPDDILQKEGSLSDAEFETMKMHTVHGKKLLLAQQSTPDDAADFALLHHEKMDGTGYPRGLEGHQIPYLIRIVAIADAYDAITSGRVYSEAKSAAEALKLLLKSKGVHHDAELLNRFIDCVGVYPIGSIAELNSGEVGIVLPSDNRNKLQPAILLLRDNKKQPCLQRCIELSTDRRADNNRPYLIRALHPDGSFDIHLADHQHAHLR